MKKKHKLSLCKFIAAMCLQLELAHKSAGGQQSFNTLLKNNIPWYEKW